MTHRNLPWCVVLAWAQRILISAVVVLLGGVVSWAQPLQLRLERPPEGNAMEVRLKGTIQSSKPMELRLQRSSDLSTWSPHGQKLRLPVGVTSIDTTLAQDPSGQGFFRISARESSFTATAGAEVLGYQSSFDDELEALGLFSVADFSARFGSQPAYLPGISWDPTNSLYWDAFQKDIVKSGNSETGSVGWELKPQPDPPRGLLPAFKLSDAELVAFRTNGFVVSERLSDKSFGDIYYNIFVRDLPVFITTDSILQAWQRSFSGVLEVVEEGMLAPTLESLLWELTGQCGSARRDYASGPLAQSFEDAEFYLSVARVLAVGEPWGIDRPGWFYPIEPAVEQQLKQRAKTALELIAAGKPVSYNFFDGRQDSEWVDFSQFVPRGHYTKSPALQRYFQTMMWLGRVDLRVAGDTNWASTRQLGTAIVLNDLLNRSGQRAKWQKFDRYLTTFIGPSDSMDFTQLDGLLRGAGLVNPKSITSMAQLESFQSRIEGGTLGAQLIASHGFVAGAGDDQIKLPRSFTFLGQRFTVDSWTFNQVVMDRILKPGEPASNPPKLVRRRLPYSLDVAFAVLGNNQIVPELATNMTRTEGVPFRDGFPYQRNLAAVRLALDARPANSWKGTLYDHWLSALRSLSTPTVGPEYPEAMRTRAWAMKTVNTQLASWTQLRHATILGVKQSATFPLLCSYPNGFVEPRPAFFEALQAMASQAATTLQALGLDRTDELRRKNETDYVLPNAATFFQGFAETCGTLGAIAQRELDREPLLPTQAAFLENTIERVRDYVGVRSYTGWYPKLFFLGDNGKINNASAPDFHDCIRPDFIVTDVHTDGPSAPDGDPGAVLHEGVGRVNLMMIAVDNGPDRMVFAGPVFSHYEFTAPDGTRLTDEAWKQSVDADSTPAPPPWTRSYLIRKP